MSGPELPPPDLALIDTLTERAHPERPVVLAHGAREVVLHRDARRGQSRLRTLLIRLADLAR